MGTLKKIKRLLANRGGFGASLSRAETIERLNPLVRRHMEVNYTHDAAIERRAIGQSGEDEVTNEMHRHQKTARADVGKLRETILSMGGVADNGVDLEPNDFDTDDADAILIDLRERERDLLDAVEAELSMDLPEHQWRTIAILENVRDHTKERLNFLKEHSPSSHRSTPTSKQQRPASSGDDAEKPPKERQAEESISDSAGETGEAQSESHELGRGMDTETPQAEADADPKTASGAERAGDDDT
jgi:hypothetical protein